MLVHRRHQCLTILALAAASAPAWACEDEHPPVATTPKEEFHLRAGANRSVLEVEFDPRGVTAVIPQEDDANRWIDGRAASGAWHYREWQWWKGHPFGDSCRPRFWTTADFRARRDARAAAISYRIDDFDCSQVFILPDAVEREMAWWDLVTSVRNVSDHDVEEYGQFFACYTPLNRGRSFWYWDESGELLLFADRGVTHLDGYVAHPDAYFLAEGAVPHCPRGGGKVVGRWRAPVMVSHASPAGWRSIIMLEPAHAASLAQGIHGEAMDYLLFPGPKQHTFAAGAEFSAHIRHVMVKSPDLPTLERLQDLWGNFERSHAEFRERAAGL